VEEAMEALLVDRFRYAGLAEACRCLEEGVASARDIDLAMLAGAGYKEGPLAWADGVGLDVALERMNALEESHGEAFRVPQVLRDLVSRSSLGRKTGRGFFEY
jgi:3-hydroxyacyl-CoA dehydrogenase